jgi:hypothetical protein
MGTAAALANAASSFAMGLGSANRATAASSVSDDDDEKSAADEIPMVSSAASATVEGGATVQAAALVEHPAGGGATVQAAALVERRRMGLPPTAGSVTDADSEGGVFLAMTDI